MTWSSVASGCLRSTTAVSSVVLNFAPICLTIVLDRLTQEDLFGMSRNATDFVYKETAMEYVVGFLRELNALDTSIRYAQTEDERSHEQEAQKRFLQKNSDSLHDSSDEQREKIIAAAADAVNEQVQRKAHSGSRKTPAVRAILTSEHTRKALMCLVSLNKHFRQDESLWSPARLEEVFLSHSGGVRDTHCLLSPILTIAP